MVGLAARSAGSVAVRVAAPIARPIAFAFAFAFAFALDFTLALSLALALALVFPFATVLAASSTAAGATAVSLTCTLALPARVKAGGPAMLELSVTNAARQPVRVLVWGTAFESAWFAPWVTVQRGDQTLAYGGAQMKRGDPTAAQYLTIGAGATRRAAIDLAPVFDLTVPGHYRVQPHIELHDVVVDSTARATHAPRPLGRHAPRTLTCNEVSFTVVP